MFWFLKINITLKIIKGILSFAWSLTNLPFAVFELPKISNFHSVKLKLLSNDTSGDIHCYSNKCKTKFAKHRHHWHYFIFNTKKDNSKKPWGGGLSFARPCILKIWKYGYVNHLRIICPLNFSWCINGRV